MITATTETTQTTTKQRSGNGEADQAIKPIVITITTTAKRDAKPPVAFT
jgi:hypothetical protein